MNNFKRITLLFIMFFTLFLISVNSTYAADIKGNVKNKTISIPIKNGEGLLPNENILHRLTNATVFEQPSSIYEFFDENGIHNIVSTSEDTVYWSTLDSNMNIIKTLTTPVIYKNTDEILKDITLTVGGYIYHQKNLYIIYTRIPSNYNDNAMALVKYDKNFKELSRIEVPAKGVNSSSYYETSGMKIPFYGSSNCSMAINSDNILAVFLGKNRFDGHQDSAIIFFDVDKMKWVSNQSDNTLTEYVGYRVASTHSIGHSLAQRVLPTSDGKILLAEQGDAGYRGSTRGVDITQIAFDRPYKPGNIPNIAITKNMFHCTENVNNNVTYNVFGNIIELSDGYLYIGGAEKTLSRAFGKSINESWNLFTQKYKKVDFENKTPQELQMFNTPVRETSGTPQTDINATRYLDGTEKDYGVKWLTDLQNKTTTVFVRPMKIENDQVVIIWQEAELKTSSYGGYQTEDNAQKAYYMIIDKDANIVTSKTEIPDVGKLSYELNYLYKDGKLYWATTPGYSNKITIHTLDIKNPLSNIPTENEPQKPVDTNKLPFKDVKKGDWFYNAVEYVYTNNIIKGYDTTTFAPNDQLTRGMMVTILHRMEGSPAVSGNTKFSDVQNSKYYYYNAVKWASDKGIVTGYDNGKFGPDDNITREQLAVILCKYAKYKGKNITQTNDLRAFSDRSKVSKYALAQMKWAVGSGVITGNKDKTLKPQGNATRAEVSAMLEKYCRKIGR